MARQVGLSYVLHNYGSVPLRLVLDDHVYWAEPGVPLEVPEGAFYAEKLVEHYAPVYGLVHVSGISTRTGYQIDIDKALEDAEARLQEAESELLLGYVRVQQEDRIRTNLPALPPQGRVKEIIERDHIDLQARFGFTPGGFDQSARSKAMDNDHKRQLKAKDDEIARRDRELADYKAEMNAKFDALMAAVNSKTDAPKK